MKALSRFNYWSKTANRSFARSAQAVMRPGSIVPGGVVIHGSDCGQGSCNCGGGCNGECGGESE